MTHNLAIFSLLALNLYFLGRARARGNVYLRQYNLLAVRVIVAIKVAGSHNYLLGRDELNTEKIQQI